MLSMRHFHRIAKNNVWPEVYRHYEKKENELFHEIQQRRGDEDFTGLEASFDAQFDSPGYCASACCGNVTDNKTGKVLTFESLFKQEES